MSDGEMAADEIAISEISEITAMQVPEGSKGFYGVGGGLKGWRMGYWRKGWEGV